jgi:DNA gyrase/topoisomerase IV subunit A
MIITKDGKIIRIESAEIRQVGRSTQGVRVVRMRKATRWRAACVIPDGEENGETAQEELPLQ